MQRVVLLAMFVFFCASLGMAQNAQNTSKWEAAAGFSVDSVDTGLSNAGVTSGNREAALGFDTSATGYFNKNFGIEGDFDGHFRSRTFTGIGTGGSNVNSHFSTYNFLAGPHYRFVTSSKVTPFVHVLLGGNHSKLSFDNNLALPFSLSNSETDFAMKIGGGVDLGLTRRTALRLGGDYNPVFERNNGAFSNFVTGSRTRNDAQFSVGIVFK
jgi:opacity protein-like surface antigen